MTDKNETARLVVLAKAGDSLAYGELYKLHFSRVKKSCYFSLVRDADRAEELAQDAFIVAYQKIGQLADPEKFCSWVEQIARRAHTSQLRHFKHRKIHESCVIRQGEPFDDTDSVVESETSEQVAELVSGLSEREQRLIYLRFTDGLRCKEIARSEGINLNSVKRILHEAIQKLKILAIDANLCPARTS